MNIQIRERKENLEKELERTVDIIIKNYFPEKIILFGSLADGNIHEWSDIDLVVIKETKERFIDRSYKINLMTDPKVGMDFIVYTPAEFQRMMDDDNYFVIDEILKRGKVLYERDK